MCIRDSVTIIQSSPRIGPSVSDPAGQPPTSAPGSEVTSTGQREVLRIELVSRLWDRLEAQRRLLILSPRRGGARTLVRQMLTRSRFAESDVTRLSPSTLAKDAEPYFAALCGCLLYTSALLCALCLSTPASALWPQAQAAPRRVGCRRWSKSVGFRCLVKAAALMVLM